MKNESCQSIKVANSIEYGGQLRWVFTYFDEDGDGKISAAELQSCLRTTGRDLSDEEAETAVRTSDADGDGMLGFDDFAQLMETAGEDEKIYELREAFRMYSATATTTAVTGYLTPKSLKKMLTRPGQSTTTATTAVTGYITPKSLKKMLTRLGQSTTVSDCKAMIRKFDLNGDGVLNFEEFSIMMR